MAKKRKTMDSMEPNDALTVEQSTKETGAQAMARKLLQPTLKNAAAASAFTGKMMGTNLEMPGIGDYADHIQAVTNDAADGDIAMVSKILAAQAVTLDSMFAELARRPAMNMGEYINAAERYGRLALKAQTACRGTLEALAKLHQPREQIVKHVNVSNGGQAVVADQFHQHRGEGKDEKSDKQSHATGAAGESSSMLGENAEGNGVPITHGKGAKKVPNARRDQSGSA